MPEGASTTAEGSAGTSEAEGGTGRKDTDFLEKKLFPLVIKSSKDKISNIRMNSASVIKKMMRNSKSRDVLRDIQASIEELKRDTDIDVVNALNDN